MSNKEFKINCSKMLIIMQIFSFTPNFAMEIEEKENVENSISSSNNSFKEVESIKESAVTEETKKDVVVSVEEEIPTEEIAVNNSMNTDSGTAENQIKEEIKGSDQKDLSSQKNTLSDIDLQNNDTTLSKISFSNSQTALTEEFNPNKKDYQVLIKGDKTYLDIGYQNIVVNNNKSKMNIYFNDDLIYENITATSSKSYKLVSGKVNVLKIVVTAENGDKATYILNVEREGSSDASLKAIGFWGGNPALTEEFNPSKTEYTAIVKGTQTTIRCYHALANTFIQANDPNATMNIYLNDTLVYENINKTNDKTMTLTKGITNVLKIVVTSENGTKKTYTINIEREYKNNATLNAIGFWGSNPSLTEEFNPDKKEYTAIVKGTQTTIRCYQALPNAYIETTDPYATMDIYLNDTLVYENIRRTNDKTMTLTKGITNVLKIVVTSEDGTTNTYTVNIERENKGNTTLNAIGFWGSNPSLTEEFDPNKKEYTAIVKGTQTTIRCYHALPNSYIETTDPYATMDIYLNDTLVYENIRRTNDKTMTLTKGITNVLKIVVTAENGDTDTYIVNIERENSNKATLKEIGFHGGNPVLEEEFNPDKKDYIAVVKGNQTTFRFYHAAQNSFIETSDPYTTMDIYFNGDMVYENITKTNDKTFTLSKQRENIIEIIVKAENGDINKYTITFKRDGYNDTKLNTIGFWGSNPSLTEDFDPEKKEYTAIVKGNQSTIRFYHALPNTYIETNDPYATMDIYLNDNLVYENIRRTNDKTMTLTKGITNVLKIVVTAENGKQDTYIVNIERENSSNANLKEIGFFGDKIYLTEDFSPNKTNYTVLLEGEETKFRFYHAHANSFIETEDTYATMDVYLNGNIVYEDVKKTNDKTFSLEKGIVNVLKIVVTSENGTKKTYTITFRRELDSNANIKEFSIHNGNVEAEEGSFKTTMDAWHNIALSELVLEDSWADYKAILNEEQEISVNENFDLSVGDNKLDIHVTANDGTVKVHPVIFERTDNEKPIASSSIDKNDCTNEDVVISISASDESGINYIELPNGEKVYSDETEFYADKNGQYTFKIYDNFLNETIEVVDIGNIDKELPTLNLKASTTELTNEGVDILVEANDNIEISHIVTPDGNEVQDKSFRYTVKKDGSYNFKAVDIAGNEIEKQITLNNIDSENPILSTELSDTNWTNKHLTLTISALSDKGIKHIVLPDESKIEDSTAKYKVKENGVYTIIAESLGGNITTEKITISNIDTKNPTVSLIPSTTTLTNKDVEINIKGTDNSGIDYIVLPNGEKVYESNYKYIVSSNGSYKFVVVDLAGNKTNKTIQVENIDKRAPVIENKEGVIDISYDVITLDLTTISSSSGIHKVILPNGEEIVNPKEDKITYKVKYNDNYTFKIVDKAGNSTNVNIEAKNLVDKKDLPNTGGLANVLTYMSAALVILGYSLSFKKRD